MWGQSVGERGQRVFAQCGRVPVQSQPQVMLGIGVAQEEPVVEDAGVAQSGDDGADGVGEDAVGGRGTGVGLEVQPLAARREGASRLGRPPRLGRAARVHRGGVNGTMSSWAKRPCGPVATPLASTSSTTRRRPSAQHLGGGRNQRGAGGVDIEPVVAVGDQQLAGQPAVAASGPPIRRRRRIR